MLWGRITPPITFLLSFWERNFPLHLLPWEEKHNNFINRRLFLFSRSHETCDPCLFSPKHYKQSEKKKSKTTKFGIHCLTNEKNLNSPTLLLGKNQHTLKLAILVLANRKIENTQPFLLVRNPRTSNYRNTS